MSTYDEDKPLQFLYEYSIRWQAYSHYLWNLSGQLEKLEEKINKCYSQNWPESTHQFRLYKLMTKIWNSEVNSKEVIFNLKDSFISTLNSYHKDCLQHLRDKSVKKETVGMEAVLKMFFQTIIDSSINQNTVHFIGSSDVTYEKIYNTFETLLLKHCSGFLKTALEMGYQSKNLKAVWPIFEEYSKIVRVFAPIKTQKQFEKSKTEMVVKFIRFILSKRLKQFKSFDFSKIEAKWNASYEEAMSHAFSSTNSVFLKTLAKGIKDMKYDEEKFQKYWLIMAGKDCDLLRKFYDSTLMSYDKLSKTMKSQDCKIKTIKGKMGITDKLDVDQMKFLSLMGSIPDKHVEDIISDYLGKYEQRGVRSLSTTENTFKESSFITAVLCEGENSKTDDSETCEDRDTLPESESTNDLVNEFSQIFKNNKQCWIERTKSMKKKQEKMIFHSLRQERRASM